jgi:hypothetical protein
VSVVAGTGQPLGGDRALLGARARLERVEEAEPDRLLELHVAVELDVGVRPELVEVLPLTRQQAVPTRMPCLCERADHLVAERRERALTRPAVGQELDDAQPLSRREGRRDRHPADLGPALRCGFGVLRPVHEMFHAGPHSQLARPRRVHEHDA